MGDSLDDAQIVRGNPLGLGLALAGAAMLLVSVFLPLSEPTGSFQFVAQSTLIQHNGWMLTLVAVGLAGSGVRGYFDISKWGSAFAGGIVAGAGVAYWSKDKSLRTLYPLDSGGEPDTTQTGITAD